MYIGKTETALWYHTLSNLNILKSLFVHQNSEQAARMCAGLLNPNRNYCTENPFQAQTLNLQILTRSLTLPRLLHSRLRSERYTAVVGASLALPPVHLLRTPLPFPQPVHHRPPVLPHILALAEHCPSESYLLAQQERVAVNLRFLPRHRHRRLLHWQMCCSMRNEQD